MIRTRARGWLALLVAAACGGPAAKPDYPTLGPSPAGSDSAAADIPAAPVPERATFSALPSTPTGAPIEITWRAPAVGDRRVRDVAHVALYSSAWDADQRRQRTVRHFRLRERVAAVTGDAIAALEVAVEDGQETVELDGPARTQTLITGEYRVELTPTNLTASRAGSGFPIGDREREELQQLYGADVGRDGPLLAVLRGRALRVGESVELTDDEQRLAGGGQPIGVPIHLTLTDVADGVARFRFAFWIDASTPADADHEARTDVRGATITLGVEVATGRVRTAEIVEAGEERSTTMTSTTHRVETTTLTY